MRCLLCASLELGMLYENVRDRFGDGRFIADDSTTPNVVAPHFELRLDQEHRLRVCLRQGQRSRENLGQGYKADIADDEADRLGNL